jgi:hypothetical protein
MRNLAILFTLAVVSVLGAPSSSSYRITQTYTLSGAGRWGITL